MNLFVLVNYNLKLIESKENGMEQKDQPIVINSDAIRQNLKKLEEEMLLCSSELYK